MNTTIYQITCKTHLHTGSGDSNYGVIDKLVQRDPTDYLPCIFSSSLKGAFREFWEEKLDKSTDAEKIFGKDDKGAVIFHQAQLLSIPIRSNKYPYFNVTAPMVIDALIGQSKLLDIAKNESELNTFKALAQNNKIIVFDKNITQLKIEDFEENNIINTSDFKHLDTIQKYFGDNVALVDNEQFLQLTNDYNLPVIARNNLDNGQSKNLWYEQIIPRESRFFFAVTKTPSVEEAELFFTELNKEQKIQIGANATIGYGQCIIKKIS